MELFSQNVSEILPFLWKSPFTETSREMTIFYVYNVCLIISQNKNGTTPKCALTVPRSWMKVEEFSAQWNKHNYHFHKIPPVYPLWLQPLTQHEAYSYMFNGFSLVDAQQYDWGHWITNLSWCNDYNTISVYLCTVDCHLFNDSKVII